MAKQIIQCTMDGKTYYVSTRDEYMLTTHRDDATPYEEKKVPGMIDKSKQTWPDGTFEPLSFLGDNETDE